MSKQELYSLTIDGQEVHAIPDSSIIQAYAHAGHALTANVGCMVILPFLMDRISRIKYSSMVAYRRWLDEAVHGCRTRANEWHSLQHRSNC